MPISWSVPVPELGVVLFSAVIDRVHHKCRHQHDDEQTHTYGNLDQATPASLFRVHGTFPIRGWRGLCFTRMYDNPGLRPELYGSARRHELRGGPPHGAD